MLHQFSENLNSITNTVASLSQQQSTIRVDLGLVKEDIKTISESQVKSSTISEIQQGLVDVTKQVEEHSDMFKNSQQEVSDNMGDQENLIKALNESITAQR